jgi:hypothetical protein
MPTHSCPSLPTCIPAQSHINKSMPRFSTTWERCGCACSPLPAFLHGLPKLCHHAPHAPGGQTKRAAHRRDPLVEAVTAVCGARWSPCTVFRVSAKRERGAVGTWDSNARRATCPIGANPGCKTQHFSRRFRRYAWRLQRTRLACAAWRAAPPKNAQGKM